MNVGGPAVLLADLIQNFPDDEIEHVLITGRCEPNEIDYLDTHFLKSRVIYLDEMKRSILPLSDLRTFPKLIWTIRKLKPDIIHTHMSKAGVLGRIATLVGAPSTKLIHTFHGHLLYGYFSRFKIFLIIQLEKVLAMKTTILITVSQQVRDDLLNEGVGKKHHWRIITPGVKRPISLDKNEARKQLEISTETFVISWIGRFTSIKNPMLAIESFERLVKQSNFEGEMIMAGDGELFNECKLYAENRNLKIRFLGWCDDVGPVISSADLLLLTSRNEGMPVVIIEAAIRNVPTLSTDVGGVREFISPGISGFLTDENAGHVAESLKGVVDQADLRKSVAMHAQKLAITNFSESHYLQSHLNIYREVVSI
jgi:glycosyltransferase involved in cell wall biosynthesis